MADQPCFAALDVSLEKTTICVMSLDGSILREAVVTTDPLLIARRALREQLILLDKRVRDAARDDKVCRRLMTTP